MHITFINNSKLKSSLNKITFPIDLAYLASYVEKRKIKTEVIDSIGEILPIKADDVKESNIIGMEIKEIVKRINDTDLICILEKNVQENLEPTLELIKLAKQKSPSVKIVVCDLAATRNYDQLFEAGVNYVMMGECEKTLYSLTRVIQPTKQKFKLNKSHKLNKLDKIKGLVYKEKEKLDMPELIKDIDFLPIPNKSLFPISNYLAISKNFTDIRTSRTSLDEDESILIRLRSVESIIIELENSIEEENMNNFNFTDKEFVSNPERFREICKTIITKKLDVNWVVNSGIAFNDLDPKALKMMKKSGLVRLNLSVNSESIDAAKLKKIVAACKENKIETICSFEILNPEEIKLPSIKKAIKQLATSGIDKIEFNNLKQIIGPNKIEGLKSDFKLIKTIRNPLSILKKN